MEEGTRYACKSSGGPQAKTIRSEANQEHTSIISSP